MTGSSEQPKQDRPRRAGRPATPLKRAMLGLATALAVMLALEAAVRVAKTIGDDVRSRSAKWYQLAPELGWAPRPGFAGKVYNTRREFGPGGLLKIDAEKLRDTSRPRVVLLGDSNTFGYNVETPETYGEQLEKLVPGARVINLGVIGYSSYQGLKRLEAMLPELKPSVIVACFNYNDRRYVVGHEQADSEAYFRRIARAGAIHQLNRDIYLLRLVGALGGQGGLFEDPLEDDNMEFARSALAHVNIETLEPRVGPRAYRENLTRIAQVAAGQGIPVIYLLLRDNPKPSGFLNEAAARIESGKTAEAIELLQANTGGQSYYSLLARKMLAGLLRQAGRAAEAERLIYVDYPIVSLNGAMPIERDADYNKIMREVAVATGSAVVDAGAALQQKPEVYMDYCHPLPPGHRIIAELLAGPVAQALKKKPEAGK
jgi:lysophospholipase L1-like esterase